jgi:hypothetical protein
MRNRVLIHGPIVGVIIAIVDVIHVVSMRNRVLIHGPIVDVIIAIVDVIHVVSLRNRVLIHVHIFRIATRTLTARGFAMKTLVIKSELPEPEDLWTTPCPFFLV